uniref:Uncharacterized protein n=1 Tax=Odontella aurita TaxID=265563 RepID=A0A7S4N0X9_9STRA|mmetsp:Transcript_43322/g.131811  ORF Transcript_43322/g.131811 Transcript_43322/m.131811 type:complete len:270 (+) Transcript_43322:332-1141(+)
MGSGPSKTAPPVSAFDRVHERGSFERELLGKGIGAVPSDKEGRPIVLSMNDASWFSKVRQHTSSPNRKEGEEYAGGLQIKRFSRSGGQGTRLELIDCSGGTVAACIGMHASGKPWVEVQGNRPVFDGQEPIKPQGRKKRRGDDVELFAWAKIRACSNGGNRQYEMEILSRARPKIEGEKGGQQMNILYKSEEVAGRNGPQTVIWKNGKPAVLAEERRIAPHSNNFETIMTIAPGIDPCIALCFIAVIGERERAKNESSCLCTCLSGIPL